MGYTFDMIERRKRQKDLQCNKKEGILDLYQEMTLIANIRLREETAQALLLDRRQGAAYQHQHLQAGPL